MGDVRLINLEHNFYELHARLMRTEESNTALSAKCQALNDSLVKCLQVSPAKICCQITTNRRISGATTCQTTYQPLYQILIVMFVAMVSHLEYCL